MRDVALPRISIVVKDDKGERQGSVSLAALGFGLHMMWIFATMFGTIGFLPDTSLADQSLPARAPFAFAVSTIVMAVVLIAAGIFGQKHVRFFYDKRVVVGSAVAMAVVTAIVFLVGPAGSAVPFSVAAGIVVGLGSAALMMFWGVSFSRLSITSIAMNTGVGIAVSVILYACLVHLIPSEADKWVIAAIPLLELPLARLSTPDRLAERNSVPLFRSLPVRRGPFAVRLAVAMILFGLAVGMLKAMSAELILHSQDTGTQMIALLLACVPTLFLLGFALRVDAGGDIRWDLLFRPMIFVVVISALLTPLLVEHYHAFSLFLLFFGYLLMEAGLWVFFVGVSQEFRLSPVFLVGIGRGALTLGAFVGTWFVFDPQLLAGMSDFYIGSLVTVTLVAGYVLSPRVEVIRKAARLAHGAPAASTDAPAAAGVPVGQDASAEQGASGAAVPGVAAAIGAEGAGVASAAAGSPAVAGQAGAAGAPLAQGSSSGGAVGAGQAFGASRSAAVSAQSAVALGSQVPGSAAGGAAGDVPVVPTAAAPVQNAPAGVPASAASSPAPAAADASSHAVPAAQTEVDEFKRVCEDIASRYLLSQRQTEVLYLLARGHNAAYIQEKLTITLSTAKSHIYNIYRKLDIHTQHELLAMVEEELEEHAKQD